MQLSTLFDSPTRTWAELELPVWGPAFLTALSETGSVTKATDAARISYTTPYAHAKKFPEFNTYWEVALAVAGDRLEEEARRRAVEGVEEPMYSAKGDFLGYKRVYSDTLLAMLLKAAKPDKYKDRSAVEVTDKTPPPAYDLTKLTDEQRDQLEAITRAALLPPNDL
jgi:hypothetical protein